MRTSRIILAHRQRRISVSRSSSSSSGTAATAVATANAVGSLLQQRSIIKCTSRMIPPMIHNTTRRIRTRTTRYFYSSSPPQLSALMKHDDDNQNNNEEAKSGVPQFEDVPPPNINHRTLLQLAEFMTTQITTNVEQVLSLLDLEQQQQQQQQSNNVHYYFKNKWNKHLRYEQIRQHQRRHDHKRLAYNQRHNYVDNDTIPTLWQNALIQAGLDSLVDASAALAPPVAPPAAAAGVAVADVFASRTDIDVGDNDDNTDDDLTKASSEDDPPKGVNNEENDDHVSSSSSPPLPLVHHPSGTPIFNFQLDGSGTIDEDDDYYNSFFLFLAEQQQQQQEEYKDSDDELLRGDTMFSTLDTTNEFVDDDKSSSSDIHNIKDDDIIPDSLNRMMNAKSYNDAIVQAITLLSVIDGETWGKFEHIQYIGDGLTLPERAEGAEDDDEDDSSSGSIQADNITVNLDDDNLDGDHTRNTIDDENKQILQLKESLQELITDPDRRLPTSVANLSLAYHLTTLYQADVLPSDKDLSDEIFENCLQIYNCLVEQATNHSFDGNEEKDDVDNDDDLFGSKYIPTESTYRLLLKAYNGRLMAYSEAIKLSRRLILDENQTASVNSANDSVKSEVLYEGLKACNIKMDLASARTMMDAVLSSDNVSIRPSLGSVMMMLDMMKMQNCRSEALEFVDKLENRRILSQNAQDKVLLSLCGWPTHSRGGERTDLSPFYEDIMSRMERTTRDKRRRCGLHVWAKLVERIELSAKFDPSLWRSIVRAMKTVSVAYPDHFLNWKMTTIGLEAARLTADADMAADILRRQDNQVPIPQRAFKACLDICWEKSNTSACDSIVETLQAVESDYPAGVRQDLYGLILMCYAKSGDGQKAMDCLQSMLNNGMDPDDRLYGAVLHTFGSTGQHEHARSIFQAIPTPGGASYDALLVSCIRSMSWDEADELYDEMVQTNISPSPQTIQAILLVKLNKYGKGDVASALESLLANEKAVFDETSFRLCSKILFRQIPGSLDDFRQDLRNDTEINGHESKDIMQKTKLELIRSIRTAEVESNRRNVRHSRNQTNHQQHQHQQQGQDEWRIATENLLKFTKELSEN